MLTKKQFEHTIRNIMNNLIIRNHNKIYFNQLYYITNGMCWLLAKLGLMAKRIYAEEE